MGEARYANMWRFMRESNYEDNDIGTDMRCTICKRILINAHSSVCGCRYCFECVRAYLDGDSKCCPGNIQDDCRLQVLDIDKDIHPDHTVNQRISRLIVACRYSCGSRCELRNIEEHERACERQPVNCPYINVGCTEMSLATDRVNEHLVGQHESHAKLLMACIDRLQSQIGSMQRDAVELRSEMRAMRAAREIDEVQARQTNEMVDQIKEEMVNLRNENKSIKDENNSLRAEIEKYRTEYLGLVAATELQLSEMQAQGETRAREMELLGEKCRRSEEKFDKLESETRREKEGLQINIDKVDEEQTRGRGDVEKRVREMEINVEMQNHEGEFIWRIDEWAAKMESARKGTCTEIYSEAFYSHRNGYKMCLAVDPDGHGAGKGTYLTVGFCLMRGPFDNILSWPFKRVVTLSLINQHTRADHVSFTATFDDFPNDVDWNKPTTDRNGGIGTYKLIELAALSRSAGLCQDDRIFFRCVIK